MVLHVYLRQAVKLVCYHQHLAHQKNAFYLFLKAYVSHT